jgi:hypothetical protein
MGIYERECEGKPFEKPSLILTSPHASVKDTGELNATEMIGVRLLAFNDGKHDQFVDFKRRLPIESRTSRLMTQMDQDAGF